METVLADGSIWRAEWDPTGRLLGETDPLGRVTRYEYGKGGLPIARIDATGKRQEMEWNRNGQVIAYTDCSKKVTRYKYDNEDNLIAATNALGEKTTYERQTTGEIVAVHHPDDTEAGLPRLALAEDMRAFKYPIHPIWVLARFYILCEKLCAARTTRNMPFREVRTDLVASRAPPRGVARSSRFSAAFDYKGATKETLVCWSVTP